MEEGTEGPLLHAKFHPHRCNVSPLRGEKPQNWPLSKLNTGRFALRAMLPVIRPTVMKAWREYSLCSVQARSRIFVGGAGVVECGSITPGLVPGWKNLIH